MIKKINRKNLDISKYSNCLLQAVNYRIYAEYWYLDALTDLQWDCLVLNDYEAVMPLPYQKKLGIKVIAQPLYCQQLGIFYGNRFTKDDFNSFDLHFRKNIIRGYHFNEENTLQFAPKGKKHVNQLISKPNTLQYSKMVKRNLSKFRTSDISIKEDYNIKKYIDFKTQYANHPINISTFFKALEVLQKNYALKIITAFTNETLAYSVFIISKNRLIYLDSVSTPKGKKLKAATGIIDYALHHLTNENIVVDFEGSSIPSIYQFYKNFGSVDAFYTKYSNIPSIVLK